MLSVHDMFPLCHDYHMVKGQGTNERYCAKKVSAASDQTCVSCIESRTIRNAIPTEQYLNTRYRIWRQILADAKAIVTNGTIVENALASAFGMKLRERFIRLEPYFQDTNETKSQSVKPHRNSDTLTVAYLGSFSTRKGGHLFLMMADAMQGQGIEFKLIGRVDHRLVDTEHYSHVEFTGAYQRQDLAELTKGVDLIVLPSIIPESYSITLSEAWALGIPVVASDLGEFQHRISQGLNGWRVQAGDVGQLISQVQHLCEHRSELEQARHHILTNDWHSGSSVTLMTELYQQCLAKELSVCSELGSVLSVPNSAVDEFDSWLDSAHLLCADADWRDVKQFNVIIVGSNQKLIQASWQSIQSLDQAASIAVVSSLSVISPMIGQGPVMLLKAGCMPTDNLGNWLYHFEHSSAYASYADYVLMDISDKNYAPQLAASHSLVNLHQRESRLGAVLIKQPENGDRLIELVSTLRNDESLSGLLIKMHHHFGHSKIDYFPFLSIQYPDHIWVSEWKQELIGISDPSLSQVCDQSTVAVIIHGRDNAPKLLSLIEQINHQKLIQVNSISVLSALDELPLGQEDASVEVINDHAKSWQQAFNQLLNHTVADYIVYVSDHVILDGPNLLKQMSDELIRNDLAAINLDIKHPIAAHLSSGLRPGAGIHDFMGLDVLHDHQFDVGSQVIQTDFLESDCFLANVAAVRSVGGIDQRDGWFFSIPLLGRKLRSAGFQIGAVRMNGASHSGIPSYAADMPARKYLDSQQELMDRYGASLYQSSSRSQAVKSLAPKVLDNHFAAFKTPKNCPRIVAYSHDNWASGFYRVKSPLTALASINKSSAVLLPHRRQQAAPPTERPSEIGWRCVTSASFFG